MDKEHVTWIPSASFNSGKVIPGSCGASVKTNLIYTAKQRMQNDELQSHSAFLLWRADIIILIS